MCDFTFQLIKTKVNNIEENEHMTLATRAAEYQKIQPPSSTVTQLARNNCNKLPKRNAIFLKFQDHCQITDSKKMTDGRM